MKPVFGGLWAVTDAVGDRAKLYAPADSVSAAVPFYVMHHASWAPAQRASQDFGDLVLEGPAGVVVATGAPVWDPLRFFVGAEYESFESGPFGDDEFHRHIRMPEPADNAWYAAWSAGASVSDALRAALAVDADWSGFKRSDVEKLVGIHAQNEADARAMTRPGADPFVESLVSATAAKRGTTVEEERANLARRAGVRTMDLSNINPALLHAINILPQAQTPPAKPKLKLSALQTIRPGLLLGRKPAPTMRPASASGGRFFQTADDTSGDAPKHSLPGPYLGPVWVPALALTGAGTVGGALYADKHRVIGAAVGAAAGVAASIAAAIVLGHKSTENPAPNPPEPDHT